MRTIIIGDIHGCYHEFISLLKKVKYRRNKDRLILLGDLMDRGPMSYEMLQWAIRWKEENPDTFFLIRGNHDHMVVEQSRKIDKILVWRLVGKGATIRSFSRHKDRMERYRPWIIENMPIYHQEDAFRCVHASVEYENLEENDVERLVEDHHYASKNEYTGKITIIGHTPLADPTHYDGSGGEGIPLPYHEWHPLPGHGTICIDTGCVFGKRLTAMIIDNGQYYLDYVESGVCIENKVPKYIKYIRGLRTIPIIRRFCSAPKVT